MVVNGRIEASDMNRIVGHQRVSNNDEEEDLLKPNLIGSAIAYNSWCRGSSSLTLSGRTTRRFPGLVALLFPQTLAFALPPSESHCSHQGFGKIPPAAVSFMSAPILLRWQFFGVLRQLAQLAIILS